MTYVPKGAYKSKWCNEDRGVVAEWRAMLRRANHNPEKDCIAPHYESCTVDKEWHCFYAYRDWRKGQFNAEFVDSMGERFELDKDLAVFGNKVYGPLFCSFVPAEVNAFFRRNRRRHTTPYTGVHAAYNCETRPFSASVQCKGVGIKVCKYFRTIEEAAEFYRAEKQAAGILLADKWENSIDPRVAHNLRNIPGEFFKPLKID